MPAATKKGSDGRTQGGQGTEGRADHEAESEGRTQQPHQPGPLVGSATSETVARATATLAPDAPSRMRPMNSIGSDPASPRMRLPIALPAMVMRRMGRRPTLSEMRPQIGENTNWARSSWRTGGRS
jgi:hypothetical protein